MEQFTINDLHVIRYSNPEIYYVSDSTGGIICYCIRHLIFRSLYFGSTNYNRMFDTVKDLLGRYHERISRSTPSLSVRSNVIGDISGIVSSYLPVGEITPLMSTSKRVMSSVGAETKRRIIGGSGTQAFDATFQNQTTRIEIELKDNKIHGFLKMKTGKLYYVAVFFEGTILGDSWFDEKDNLIASRVFNGTMGASVPISLGTPLWFDYQVNNSILSIGNLNTCQLDLSYGVPGKIIPCGHFNARYLAKNSPLIGLYPQVYRSPRLDIGIEPGPLAWITSNNLPLAYEAQDSVRQNLLSFYIR